MARVIAERAVVALLCLTLSLPAHAQTAHLGGGEPLNLSLTRIVAALILCLMVAALAALLLKRGGGRVDLARVRALVSALPAKRRIEPIETRRISQYADLCLVRCDGQEYLILSSQQQQLVLRSPDTPAPAETAE